MNVSDMMRAMQAVDIPADKIVAAVAELADRSREKNAARQRRFRERQRVTDVALHDVSNVSNVNNTCNVTPLEQKELFPPTPPLLEKLNPPSCASLRSALVDEPVDPQSPSVKKLERAESDEKLLDEITDAWNAWALAHRCPQVKFLTKARGQHCRMRLKDIANGEGPVVAFRKVLSKCETSFFVRGSPRGPLKFDQLMREGFLMQMLEGAFEYREGNNQWRR